MKAPRRPRPSPGERRSGKWHAQLAAARTPEERFNMACDWFRGSAALARRRGRARAAASAREQAADALAHLAELLDRNVDL